MLKKIKSNYPLLLSFFLCFMLVLPGCDLANNQIKHDRAGHAEFQDFRDGLAPRVDTESDAETEMTEEDMGGIPELKSYVADASEDLHSMPLVSLSINQTIPLKDALFELAEQTEYDLELDPRIKGSIIFTARNKPLDVVIDKIANSAGLRYSFEGKSLRIELDNPYNKTYKIEYLNFVRSNSSSIRNDVSVVSGEGADTGSSFEASSTSESDFWGELGSNLQQILSAGDENFRTQRDPRITSATPAQQAPLAPVISQAGGDSPAIQAPEATLQVDSLPTEEDDDSGSQSSQSSEDQARGSFSLNKQAGLITVYATDKKHKEVREYLKELKKSVTSQVLIEAKVFEVTLTDEYSFGVGWSVVDLLSGELNIDFSTFGGALNADLQPVATPDAEAVAVYDGNDFNAAMEAISRLGTVRALASPRMTVLNNQSAVLNVANNRVYFTVDIDVTTDEGDTQTEIESEIRNVPEGVLINMQPSIDLERRKISMSVRPTVTRIVDFVEDPAVQYITAENNIEGVTNEVPVVNVQEMDSIIQVNSGQAIVMGGLMQDRVDNTEIGVPVLSEVPVLGNLFKTHSDDIRKSELVVFLRATIIDSEKDTVYEIDRDLYKKFSGDRRPLKL